MSRFVELNHEIRDGMEPYPGLPRPKVGALLGHAESRERYQGQAEFYLGCVEMPGNVGTYLDSPFHRYADREDLSQIPLDKVAGLPGIVLDAVVAPDRSATADFEPSAVTGRAVLLRSGWDRRWGTTSYWEPGPYVGPSLLQRLVDGRPALVGADFWNVDDTRDPARPVHTRLLAEGILIVENLCGLSSLPASGFRFHAVPLRLVRGASFPVRAYAELDADRATEG
jgi:kynurenine formamidase